MALILSFAALRTSWRTPRLEHAGDGDGRLRARRPGHQPGPTWLYIWFWVGLVPASLLLGPIRRLLTYGLVHLAASMVYGQAWFARGDGFEVYFTLLASLCPFGRRRDGRLVVRNPLAGPVATSGPRTRSGSAGTCSARPTGCRIPWP